MHAYRIKMANATFDETFQCEIPDIKPTDNQLSHYSLEVTAVDTNTLLPGGAAIGRFIIDLESVYFEATGKHELCTFVCSFAFLDCSPSVT